MASKSPIKTKGWREAVYIQKIAFGYLVYSYADKQSNSGITKNSRILLMDTIHGFIGFYNQDKPPEFPIQKIENLPEMKKKAPIATSTILRIKNKNAIEIKVSETDSQGKKINQKWVFNFKNNKMTEDWVKQITEAKQNLTKQPPMSHTVGPRNLGNSNVGNLAGSSMLATQPPIYPNQILSQSIADPKRSVLPIDQPDLLASNLIVSAAQSRPPINTVYQSPTIANNDIGNSRLTNNISNPASSNVRITSSTVQPNNNTSNNNPIFNNTVPNIRAQSGFGNNSSINKPNSVVQPSVNNSYRNPQPKMDQSKVNPPPINYSRYSQRPNLNSNTTPVTISENKRESKRSLQQSNIGKPPIYQSGNDRDWNLEFLNSNNPIGILMGFRQKAEVVATNIIDELGTSESKRKYIPYQKQPFESYNIGTLIVNICFLTKQEIEYKSLKNEFRNYDYIINVTENQHIIKVPLVAIINYKGMTALVKARIPRCEEIPSSSIYRQLQELEQITKIDKQIFNTNGIFYKFTSGKTTIIFVDELRDFIPFDLQSTQKASQFRKQFMESERQILPGGEIVMNKSNKHSKGFTQLDEASNRMREYGLDVTKYFQSMDLSVINTSELTKQFHFNGVSMRCLGLFCGQCDNPLIKRYLISEIASRVCKKIMRSELQQQIIKMQQSHSQLSNNEPSNMILLDVAYSVLNDIVSQNDRSDRIWRLVIQQVKRKFNFTISKQDLSIGYFLSSIFDKSGLQLNYKYFIKDKNFLRSPNTLRRQFVMGFKPQLNIYHIGFTEEYRRINTILNSDPVQEGFHQLVEILELKVGELPEFCNVYQLDSRIKWYMGNFIAYGSQEYKQIGIYNSVGQQPPTVNSIKQSLLAMKWLRKNPSDQNGNAIFEVATDLITFWGGEYHPLHSDLYDFVSGTHVITGNFEAAVTLAKSSLQNCIKISKANSLASGQKYYQLGDIYFKMGKKQDALANYQITRQILQVNKKTNLNQYGAISLKLALLNLNFSKNSEAAAKALEALRIFEAPPVQEEYMLQTYQVLSRAYEISNQKGQSLNLASLCSKKLPTIKNPKVYERMLKIVLFPHLINLPSEVAKDVLMIYEQIPKSANLPQATQFLKSQTSEHSGLQFQNKLQKLDRILGQIHNKNLMTKYKGISSANQGEAEQFLAYLEAIGTILGDNFVMGVLIQASE